MTVVSSWKENLDALIHRHCHDKVDTVQFQIAQLNDIASFTDRLSNLLGCQLYRARLRHAKKCEFGDPSSIDIGLMDLEFVTIT